ncbi:Hypothetical predicted protein, partial [Paramuricea clavata]
LTRSATKTYGRGPTRPQQTKRYRKEDGDGWGIHCANQHPTPQDKPSHGILKGKGKEADHETPGNRDLEADTKKMGYTWGQLVRVAQDRDTWKTLVDGLCSRLG